MYINILYSIGWEANAVKFYYLKVVDSILESYSDEIWDLNIKDSKKDSIVFWLIGEKTVRKKKTNLNIPKK